VAAEDVARREPYAAHLGEFPALWNYAGPEETEGRLRAAGFTDVRCWLEPWPVHPPEPEAFSKTVCLGPYVAELPGDLADRFVADVLATQEDPLRLEYVRLNIEATAA
jgi:trans-aconitate 2-methyltransferase